MKFLYKQNNNPVCNDATTSAYHYDNNNNNIRVYFVWPKQTMDFHTTNEEQHSSDIIITFRTNSHKR
jgi:hypothetical protein